MLSFLTSLNSLSAAFIERAGAVAWQWTILVLILALPAQWLLRGHAPTLRYWVWQIVLLKLLLMPFWTYALPVAWLPREPAPSPVVVPVPEAFPSNDAERPKNAVSRDEPPAIVTTNVVESKALPTAPSPRIANSVWLVIVWSAIVVIQGARLIYQRYRLSQLLVQATPADSALLAAAHEAANLLGLATPPRVLLTGQNVSPFVCGQLRPTLVLPAALTSSLSQTQLRQVLLHELAHIRRRDLLWGWIPQAARMLWFAHPVVHWVVYRLRLERELACDQLAMTLSGESAADYAQTLIDVVTHTSMTPPLRKGGPGGSPGLSLAPNHEPSPLNS